MPRSILYFFSAKPVKHFFSYKAISVLPMFITHSFTESLKSYMARTRSQLGVIEKGCHF